MDGSVAPGRRLVNWVWYRNVAPGGELEDLLTDRDGERQAVSLAPGLVQDRHVARMVFGRICLIGDAAFALRPHAAAGTAKAAEDAWQLAEAVKASGGDIVAALKRWEPCQLALGRQVLARTREAGNRT